MLKLFLNFLPAWRSMVNVELHKLALGPAVFSYSNSLLCLCVIFQLLFLSVLAWSYYKIRNAILLFMLLPFVLTLKNLHLWFFFACSTSDSHLSYKLPSSEAEYLLKRKWKYTWNMPAFNTSNCNWRGTGSCFIKVSLHVLSL